MMRVWEEFRRQMAPVSLRLWPSLSNPAWESIGAARRFGSKLRISAAPAKIASKIEASAAVALKQAFLVSDLCALPSAAIEDLYTYHDMADIARHGENWRATRLGRWLAAGIAAGRPASVRGEVIAEDGQIERYYRRYLDMYRSMQSDGYRYEGKDEMRFGICEKGGLMLIRGGTHRLAAARILNLPEVTGIVTHIDRKFALECAGRAPRLSIPDAIMRGVEAVSRP